MSEGGDEGLDGIVTAQLEGAVESHEDGLSGGAIGADVMKGILADEHGGSDFAFGEVVVEGDAGLIQEGEEGVAIFGQALGEAFDVGIAAGVANEFIETHIEAFAFGGELLGGAVLALGEPDGVVKEAFESGAEVAPDVGVVFVVDGFEFAQEMDQAHLAFGGGDTVVSGPEVGDQSALEGVVKEALQGFLAARAVDLIIGHVAVGETPQPVGLARDAVPGFIGVQDGALEGAVGDLVVPRDEDIGQAMPGLDQPAGADLELQMGVEDLGDLRDGVAEAVVEPGGEGHDAMSELSLGHGVGNDRFDQFAAVFAVTTGDDVFDGFGLDNRDVLDDTGAFLGGWSDRSAAVGTTLEGVFLGAVDARGLLAMRPLMTGLSSGGFLAPRGGVGLLERRDLAGGGAGGDWIGGLEISQSRGQGQNQEDDGLGALGEDLLDIFPPQVAQVQTLKQCFDRLRCSPHPTQLRRPDQGKSEAKTLQTGKGLRLIQFSLIGGSVGVISDSSHQMKIMG